MTEAKTISDDEIVAQVLATGRWDSPYGVVLTTGADLHSPGTRGVLLWQIRELLGVPHLCPKWCVSVRPGLTHVWSMHVVGQLLYAKAEGSLLGLALLSAFRASEPYHKEPTQYRLRFKHKKV